MQLLAIAIVIVAGGALAALALTAFAISRAEQSRSGPVSPPDRASVEASILFHVVAAGGVPPDEAMRQIRREAGLAAPIIRGIDVCSWAASYARAASAAERAALLETTVRLVTRPARLIPLRQYASLLDLSFGLGFQTDALARLREAYGFDYVDHAKEARPRSADRSGGATRMFERQRGDAGEWRRMLGVGAGASLQEIAVAYRRLVSQHHPDRFHGASPEEESAAATRFIEITHAYEELTALLRE